MTEEEFLTLRPPLTDKQYRSIRPHLEYAAKPFACRQFDIEDLCQEAMIALSGANWTDPVATVETAMETYVRDERKATMYGRRLSGLPEDEEPTYEMPPLELLDLPFDINTEEGINQLRSLEWLTTLPDEVRAVAVAVWRDGKKPSDVAKGLGVRVQYVIDCLDEVTETAMDYVFGGDK